LFSFVFFGLFYHTGFCRQNGSSSPFSSRSSWFVKISFASPLSFNNTISGSGTPSSDPKYYYTTPEFIKDYNTANSTTYTEAYFVIEGLRDGLQHFQSYEIPDSDNYNLQGVIIVPSRAAFARDAAFPYNGTMTDKSIVFNFQIYKTEAR
jgi:hypothetical protein